MKYAQNRKQNNHLVKIYILSSKSVQNVRLHTHFTISVGCQDCQSGNNATLHM